MKNEWQTLSAREIEELLDTNTDLGMSESLAEQKREAEHKKKKSGAVSRFLAQLADVYSVLMIAIAVFLIASGNAAEGLIALAAVLVKGVCFSVRAAKLCDYEEKLKMQKMPRITVVREGKEWLIPVCDAVSGDVVRLNGGDEVYFPMRIVSGDGLITLPENAPVDYEISDADKNPEFVLPAMRIAFGEGKGVVMENTYAPSASQKTDERKKFEKIIYLASGAVFVLCMLLTLPGIISGGEVMDYLLPALGLFLVACPLDMLSGDRLSVAEGLIRCEKYGVIQPEALRTLSASDTLLADETVAICPEKLDLRGIVTEYRDFDMQRAAFGKDTPIVKMMLEMACLASDAKCGEDGVYKGSAFDMACVRCASDFGVFKKILDEKHALQFKENKGTRRTVGVLIPNGVRVISMGETEEILNMCDEIMADGALLKLNDAYKSKMLEKANVLTEAGMQVRSLAFSDNDGDTKGEKTNLIFLGVFGCTCRKNEEGAALLGACGSKGITPVLLTALNRFRAIAAAEEYTSDIKLMTAEEFRSKSDGILEKEITKYNVFCDMQNEDKARAARLLKQAGRKTLVLAEKQEDILLAENASAALACGEVSESVKAVCCGFAPDKARILRLISAVRIACANEQSTLRQGIAVKFGVLLFGLLSVPFITSFPLSFTQFLWIGAVLLPLTFLFICKNAGRQSRNFDFADKKTLLYSLGFGGLLGLISLLTYFFGRFTIPSASEADAALFAGTLTFWFLCIGVFVTGLQTLSSKILLSGAFLKNRRAALYTIAALAATLVIALIPPAAERFGLYAMRFTKGIWLIVFVLLTILAADLVKFIEYMKKEKKK